MSVIRSILGAIVGYVGMVAVVFTGIGLAWAVLGGAGAFAGEGPAPSGVWIASNFVFGLLAAIVGGKVARAIGGRHAAVKILVALILILGVVTALTYDSAYEKRAAQVPADKSVAELSFMEAGGYAKQPGWYNWLIPIVGVVGVLIGGRGRAEV